MKILFKNIEALLQTLDKEKIFLKGSEMKNLSQINNAYLLIENDKIIEYGKMNNCPNNKVDKTIDASNKFILPTWCDSHTHIVYAGSREEEFVDRILGLN